MTRRILVLALATCLCGCSKSESYKDGQALADQTYGTMAPQEMVGQVDSILPVLESQIENAENSRDWWNGFCDRGEEIWLARIDEMNDAMGTEILNPDQIEIMFDKMRSSYRE